MGAREEVVHRHVASSIVVMMERELYDIVSNLKVSR